MTTGRHAYFYQEYFYEINFVRLRSVGHLRGGVYCTEHRQVDRNTHPNREMIGTLINRPVVPPFVKYNQKQEIHQHGKSMRNSILFMMLTLL